MKSEVTETKENNESGRPSAFKQEYIELAYNYCSLGAREKELTKFFGVDEKELIDWKIKYPKFQNAIKRGEIVADANVASSLYRRAIGYSHPETLVSNVQGEIIKTEITKHYPPDVQACIHWLCNRQPKLWGNVTGLEFEPSGDID